MSHIAAGAYQLFYQLPIATALLDGEMGIVRCNDLFSELADRREGQPLLETIHPEDRGRIEAALEKVGERDLELTFRLLHENGRQVWVSSKVRKLQEPAGILMMLTDETVSRQSEEILSLYTARLETVQQIISGILESRTVGQLAERVMYNLLKIIPYDCSCIVLFDGRGEVRDCFHRPDGADCSREQLAGFCSRFVNSRQMVLYPEQPGAEKQFPVAGVRRMAVVPLLFRERQLGLLLLGSRIVHFFGNYQLDVLRETGEIIAVGLHRLQLVEALDIESHKNIRLLQEVNHRVKNNLTAILGMLYESRRHLKDEGSRRIEEFAGDMISRVHGMSVLHQELSAVQWRPVQVQLLLRNVVSAVMQQRFGSRYRLQFAVEPAAADVTVPPEQAHHLGLIATEIATNAGKHAAAQQQLLLKVFIAVEGGLIKILFQDNGPGFPEQVLNGGGFSTGLTLVEGMTVSGLNGECLLDNKEGAVVTVRFAQKKGGEGD